MTLSKFGRGNPSSKVELLRKKKGGPER